MDASLDILLIRGEKVNAVIFTEPESIFQTLVNKVLITFFEESFIIFLLRYCYDDPYAWALKLHVTNECFQRAVSLSPASIAS